MQEKYDFLKKDCDKKPSGNKLAKVSLDIIEDRFKKFVERAPIAMAIVSMEGVIEFINLIKLLKYLDTYLKIAQTWIAGGCLLIRDPYRANRAKQ